MLEKCERESIHKGPVRQGLMQSGERLGEECRVLFER